MVIRIAVIGAGAVGLSSAVVLQESLPHAQVEILSDKFTRHTTSDGAGGIFIPNVDGIPEHIGDRWAQASAQHFFDLARSTNSSASGVNFITGYELTSGDQNPRWRNRVLDFHEMPNELFQQFSKFYKKGYMFTTVVVTGPTYLPWLTQRFISRGGLLKHKKVKSFDELSGEYDLVINCSGLGAGQLASDPSVAPCRGHILRVHAPWIKHFFHSDDNRYVLPAAETVAIGGVKQIGRTDLAPDPVESERIWRDAVDRFPPLEGAKILWEWVGLRPCRDKVRVEAEVVNCNGKQLKVIHNYGHGSYGISLSWGTAVYTAELAQAALQARPRM